MIDFLNIYKAYGGQELLKDVSLRINPGERIGIVGPNGAGKTTLFGLITGEVSPDKGKVAMPQGLRIGYLRQQLPEFAAETSLLDFTAEAVPEIARLAEKIHRLEHQLAEESGNENKDKLLRELGHLQTQFEHLGAYRIRHQAEAALSGLGFAEKDFIRPLREFSGGWQMRAALARVLIADAELLMLDEPSNYLDLPAVEWLARFLTGFQCTIMLISHDRYLLKALTSITLEINGGKATRYSGDYNFYMREREVRTRTLEAARKTQDRKREQLERSIERFRSKNTKAAQVQSWIKSLDRMEDIDTPDSLHFTGSITIPPPPASGREIVRLEKVSHSYDGGSWILKDVDLSIARGEKFAIVGYNGTGKTTLLRSLAGQLQTTSGKRVLGHKVVCGYQAQEFAEILPPEASAFDVVRSAATGDATYSWLRSILGSFGFSGDAADKPCKVLSGGEKIRLCFARIFVNPPNFLVLDEPTTHLDIAAREALQQALANYQGTFCLVSHDLEFVRNCAETIIAMSPPGLTRYYGNYDYYREKLAASATTVQQTEEIQVSEDTRKVRRKERAERRSKLTGEKKRLEKLVRDSEKLLEKLEEEQHELAETMSSGTPDTDFAAVSTRLNEIKKAIEKTTAAWEAHALALDEIETQYSQIHKN